MYKNIVNYSVLDTWGSKPAFRRSLEIEARKAQICRMFHEIDDTAISQTFNINYTFDHWFARSLG